MNDASDLSFNTSVSIHGVWEIKEGKLDEALAAVRSFEQRMREDSNAESPREVGNLYYQWAVSDDETKVTCREAYKDAASVEAHLQHLGDLFGNFLAVTTVKSAFVAGPRTDVQRLKNGAMQGWNQVCVYYHVLE